ncbi:MAG: Crp/Fnr family transcriptional regulator [Candidatus Delongbacteria bacterium]|nr:Crp/Fnr family transcriptional regulator [Candidatus Delongbacteria bacterium]
MKGRIEYLKKSNMFKRVKDKDIESILDICSFEEQKKGNFLFEEGISCHWVYFVCEGRVKLLAHSSSGRDFILKIVSSNDLLSDNNVLFDRIPECIYSAQALEDSVLMKIRANDFIALLDKYHEINKNYNMIIDMHLREAYFSLKNMAFEKVERRIARHLIKFANNTGEQLKEGLKLGVKLSRQEIANLTGTTIETAIRVMSKFKKEKIIAEKGGYIFIKNKHGLVRMADDF